MDPSNHERIEAITNVLKRLEKKLCEYEGVKVESFITQLVQAFSEEGSKCLSSNWNYVRLFSCLIL